MERPMPRLSRELRGPPRILTAAALLAFAASAAPAQDRSYVELQTDRQSLTAGYAGQAGVLLRSVIDRSQRTVWTVDVAARRAFLDDGVNVGVLGITELQRAPVILSAGLSASAGGFFLPKVRADIGAGRKWLSRQQLLTAATARLVEAKDGHRDYGLGVELTWYASTAVLQFGSMLNISQPGGVASGYHRAAITLGSPNAESLVIYGGAGREAYQLIAPDAPIVNSRSGSFGGAWRRWMRNGWGTTVGVEGYQNSAYNRAGLSLGVMRRFGPIAEPRP
jgi:YaiO family outer membrane protein